MDKLLEELKKQADEGFPKAMEEWERSVATWGGLKYHLASCKDLTL
jgi:hypothetical protein